IQAEIANLPKRDELQAPLDHRLGTISAIEVAKELRERSESVSHERRAATRHGVLTQLFSAYDIYCDTTSRQIVGLRPHESAHEAIRLMLERGGWYENAEGLLRRRDPGLPQLATTATSSCRRSGRVSVATAPHTRLPRPSGRLDI